MRSSCLWLAFWRATSLPRKYPSPSRWRTIRGTPILFCVQQRSPCLLALYVNSYTNVHSSYSNLSYDRNIRITFVLLVSTCLQETKCPVAALLSWHGSCCLKVAFSWSCFKRKLSRFILLVMHCPAENK